MSNYARFLAAFLCTLILTPVVVTELGPRSYGLWTLALCVAGYLELFDCGLAAGTMKYIAAMSPEAINRKNRLMSTMLVTSAMLSFLVGGLCAILIPCIVSQSVASHERLLVTAIICLVSVRVVISLPFGVFMGLLFAEHRIWLINTIRLLSVVVFSVAAYVSLKLGYGIVSLGIVYAIVYTLESIAYLLACVVSFPWMRVFPRTFDSELLKEVGGFSLSTLTANSANVLLMRTDPMIVSASLSLSAVAMYAVPLRITEQLFILSKQLINVFSPLYAELHSRQQSDSIRRAYLTCTKLTLGLMIGVVIPAIFFSREGLVYWIGPEFAASSTILCILLCAAILRVIQESSSNALAMTGQHSYVAKLTILSALGNIVLSLVLVGPFGLTGVASATLISVATVGAALATLRACRQYQIRIVDFLRQVVVCALVPIAIQLVSLIAGKRLIAPTCLLDLFALSSMSGLLYLVSYYLFSLDSIERATTREWLDAVFRRLSRSVRGTNLRRASLSES